MTNPTFKSALVFSPADLPDWADPDCFTERDEEDERGCLLVYEDGKVQEHWGGGEPEDHTFGRSWAWVAPTIDRAYQAGVADGRAQALAEYELRRAQDQAADEVITAILAEEREVKP